MTRLVPRGARRAAARAAVAMLAALAAGCSDFVDQGDGVIAIEVRGPRPGPIVVGDTLLLAARALDRNGDSVPAALVWRSADSVVSVDSALGIVVGRHPGRGRVQAFLGALASPLVELTVTAPPETPDDSGG